MEVRIWDCDSRLCTHRLQAPLKKEISGVSMGSNTVINAHSFSILQALFTMSNIQIFLYFIFVFSIPEYRAVD